MRKIFALLLLILVSSILLISPSPIQAANGDIVLQHLSGEVQYKSASWLFFSSRWKDLKESTYLSKGDVIKTGSEGQAQLTFANQARTLIKSNSKLKIVEHDEELGITKVKLSLGEVLTKFVNTVKSGQRFEVETPSAVAGVRGTLFRVVVNDKQETQVAVSEGRVEVSSDGGAVVIEKGEGAIVREKKEKPEVVPAGKIEAEKQQKNEGQGRARGKEKGKGKPEEEWLEENKEWAQEAKKEAKKKAEEAKENGKDKDDHPGNGKDSNKDDDHPGVGNDKDDDHPGNNSSNSNSNSSNNSSNSSSSNNSNSNNSSSNSSNSNSSNSNSNNGRGRGK
ncbi:FecR family protein [Halanaerobacter jeridensis]|uniref:FecR protein domain-containing protein n=1 Tax=Halanaerobacter jeridensis TaxID=706427 RepID=A0A939BS26_9FIRM|nr:FecR family protein [Halanaerobacter jeridensis]MBM7556671.1 hypothetical protein [Halanaerobacter jeridensis]